jgi:hypothetical protein
MRSSSEKFKKIVDRMESLETFERISDDEETDNEEDI